MKPLEDVFAAGNRAAGIPDSQHYACGVSMRADPDPPAGAIVFSRILQEILDNQRSVAFFTPHKQVCSKFLLNFYFRRIRKSAEIIKPFVNKLAEIHRCGCDLKVAGIHARQKEQIVDDASQAMRLVKQRGKLLIYLRLKIFTRQQCLQTETKNRDRAFQLMGSVGRISCRSFQFLRRRSKRGFSAPSSCAIFL